MIGVVVPAYNVETYLPAMLDSLRGQQIVDWQCVIVDDGSQDATFDIARRYAALDHRIQAVRQPNAGPSAARNSGFRLLDVRARFVTFMDADDVWLPNALAALLRKLEANPSAVGSHGLAETIDGSGSLLPDWRYAERGRRRLGLVGRSLRTIPLDAPTDFNVLINGNVLFPPGLLIARREHYDRAGPFDESFRGPEDWDMLIRLSRIGPIAFTNEVILHYRRHTSNLGAQLHIPVQAWLVRAVNFHSPENSPEQRVLARRGWRAYQKLVAREAAAELFGRIQRREGGWIPLLGRIAACVGRYLRGYPRPVIVRQRLRW